MFLSRRLGKVLSWFFLSMAIFTGAALSDSGVINIAVLPCKDEVITFTKFHPLADYLKEKTGLEVKLTIPEDSAALEKDLKTGDINFAYQDPYTYVRLSHFYNKKFLLKSLNRDGGTLQSGVVITRKDSGIVSLKELKGKTVMFGPKLSANTWMFAKLLFEENGFDLDKDLRNYSHGKCCEEIAFSVFLKKVDAGIVCDHFIEEHSNMQEELGIDAEELMVIGQTKKIPTNVFAANRTLSEDFIQKINQALLKMDRENSAHAEILLPAEIGGFEMTTDDNYNEIRTMIDNKGDNERSLNKSEGK